MPSVLLRAAAGLLVCGSATAAALPDGYLRMPDGRAYHASCVHHHGAGFHAERLPGGRTRVAGTDTLPPCPFPAYDPVLTAAVEGPSQYYSDWSVYAQTAGAPYTYMTSTWKVPPPPASRGPLGLSSVYLFNGLEDGAGHHGNASLILQPVLLFGKSGCLLNPTQWGQWHLGACESPRWRMCACYA